jgi:hypothetical protein
MFVGSRDDGVLRGRNLSRGEAVADIAGTNVVPDPVRRARVTAMQARILIPEDISTAIGAHEMRRGIGSGAA